jgi:RNA polymerase sigma-B factor
MPDIDLDRAATTYAERTAGSSGGERDRLRDDFVRTCLPFAGRLARRYRGRGEPFEDLEQVARLGLVKAIDRFDTERGSFTAYAVMTIFGEIKKHFRDTTWAVHVTRRVQEAGLDVKRAGQELLPVLNREPTPAEIARHLDVPIGDVQEALRSATGYWPASLNAPARGEGDSEIIDLLGDRDSALDSAEDRLTMADLLRHLPAREQRMLSLRFYGNLSQAEIAADLGISQMHVSRLLRDALTWLREAMLNDDPPVWHGSDPLRHTVRLAVQCQARTLVVAVSGEIDHDTAQDLRHGLQRAMSGNAHDTMILDLARVPLIDAAGVTVLLDAARGTAVANRRLRLAHVTPSVAHVLDISGLGSLTR